MTAATIFLSKNDQLWIKTVNLVVQPTAWENLLYRWRHIFRTTCQHRYVPWSRLMTSEVPIGITIKSTVFSITLPTDDKINCLA